MLRSSIQLVESHGDDFALEYLWNGDEYGSLENSLKAIKKPRRIWRTTRNLSPSAGYWWFAYDVIKNMTMPIMINFSQILIWPVRPYNVSLYQI